MTRKIGSRYTITQVIGRGTCGTVWEGTGPDGPVAVKLLREDLSADQTLIARFVQERSVLTSLDHPNVVAVRDLVVDGTDLALVMDLVPGSDLRERLDTRGAFPPAEAAGLAAGIASGLAAAHARGVVHRDVKPENVLLDALTGAARLTDFGIARLVDGPRRTRATRIVGTPDYLAPEVIEGCPPGPPVDVYALGTVLFELLTGWTPFGGGHPGAVLRRHVTETTPQIPGMPGQLTALLTSCLSKAPAARLTAAEVAARLRALETQLIALPALRVADPRAVVDPSRLSGGHGPVVLMTVGAVPLVSGSGQDIDDSRQTHYNLMQPIREPLGPSTPVPGAPARPVPSYAPPPGFRPGARTGSRTGWVPAISAVLAAIVVSTAGYLWWTGQDKAHGPRTAAAAGTGGSAGTPADGASPAARPVGPLGLLPSGTLTAPPVALRGAPHYVAAGPSAYVVITGADGTVRVATGTAGGSPRFGPWQPLPGLTAASDPAVVGRPTGAVEVYVTGADGQVYRAVHEPQPRPTWSPWSSLAANGVGAARVAGAPAAATLDANRTELVAASETGGLLATVGTTAGAQTTWQPWHAVAAAGTVKPDVALAARPDGVLAAYVIRGSDLAILRVLDDGRWEPGWPTGAVGRPEAAYTGAGVPYLFIRAVTGDVQIYKPSGADLRGTMSWVATGVTSQSPVGVARAPGRGLVLAVTAQDGAVQLYTWDV